MTKINFFLVDTKPKYKFYFRKYTSFLAFHFFYELNLYLGHVTFDEVVEELPVSGVISTSGTMLAPSHNF